MSDPESDEEDLTDTKAELNSQLERSSETDADEEQSPGDEILAATQSELESLTDSSEDTAGQSETDDGETGGDERSESNGSPAELLDRAEANLEAIIELLSNQASRGEVNEEIADLHTVADEARELLTTVELTELPDAIDYSNLDEVIEVSDIPDALAEGDIDEAIQYSELLAVIEFDELLDTVDLREFRQNKDELTDTIDEFTAERETDDELVVYDILTSIIEALDIEAGSDGGALDAIGGEEANDVAIDGQAKQAAIQSQLHAAIEDFRESVFDAREQIKEVREEANDRITEETGGLGQPTSRNPTAFSTLTSVRTPTGDDTRYSTVPPSTRYSTAVSHQRIYGSRFEHREDDHE